ncbi:hypothetical protein [Nonlabens dokdonensis]|jgi:hypothetical protein|uniref:Outer membrane protein beta-barrel domain-containing protein n=2 Tax=Nonlabens dokdonensis TaxID=328515 RepID=L7WF39_NONDD|nr:hypothetical protein [Nonlabens dokdonensis]AGC77508.1 hypothetical protein DDD_2381 [Nonlabens dokdonensis DSW-6]
MIRKLIFTFFLFFSINAFSQGMSYGVSYGQGLGDNLNYSISIEYNYYFIELGDNLELGLATSGTYRDIDFEPTEFNPDGYSEAVFQGGVGVATRYYLSDLFKVNLDAGYEFSSSSDQIASLTFIKPYLELDLDSFSIISGPSFAFNSDYTFTSFNLGFRFKNLY